MALLGIRVFPEGRREPFPAVQGLGAVFYFWPITVDS